MALNKEEMLQKAYEIGLSVRNSKKAICPFGRNGDLRSAWEIGKEETELEELTSKTIQVS